MDIKQQWEATPTWQKIFLIFTFSGALAYFIFNFFLSPKIEEYSNLEKEVQDLESKLEALKLIANPEKKSLYEKKIESLKKEMEEANRQLETLSKIIPPKPMVEDILKVITSYANLDNIVINSFKLEKEEEVFLFYDKDSNSLKTIPKEEPKEKDNKNQQQIPKEAILVKKVYINTNVSGSFDQLKKFLNDISNSKRLIIVDNITVKKESFNSLNFNINFITYYIPEEASK